MRTYKRKSDRGNTSKDTFEKAAAMLEEDETKTIRGVAKQFGLCHMSLVRYLKKLKEAKENGTSIESITMGYTKNNQVFNDEQEGNLVTYLTKSSKTFHGLTEKDVRQLAVAWASKHKIKIPESWRANRKAGADWLTAFLKRNQSLSLKSSKVDKTSGTSSNQTIADNSRTKSAEAEYVCNVSLSIIQNVDDAEVAAVEKPGKLLIPKASTSKADVRTKKNRISTIATATPEKDELVVKKSKMAEIRIKKETPEKDELALEESEMADIIIIKKETPEKDELALEKSEMADIIIIKKETPEKDELALEKSEMADIIIIKKETPERDELALVESEMDEIIIKKEDLTDPY